MAPTRDSQPPAPAWGELVVQTGRLAGTRWPLTAACHAIGRQEGCDFRLNAAGVSPLHCVIVRGPDGPALRDLRSTTGTFVNGSRVESSPLRDGDRLTVGPFEFRLERVAPPLPTRDALRVQVAAVAAQQA